jgi:hypothetical protein
MKHAGPSLLERAAPPALLRWEGALVCLIAWGFLLAIPLSIGELGLSWDALNHHIYLGWTAEQQRFDHDFLGAGYQSFQSPYLYWPVYRMATSGWGGTAAGAVLASLHLVVVWPVWMLARACVPGPAVSDVALRILAVALALTSGVILSAFDSSMNDVLAAAPLVWAVALAMEPAARVLGMAPAVARRYVVLSGLGAGLAVALKLSAGPLAIFMPGLWLLCAQGLRARLVVVTLGSLGALAGFALGYGYWGWLLWRHFGNPVFPFYGHWFAPLRGWLGWVAG